MERPAAGRRVTETKRKAKDKRRRPVSPYEIDLPDGVTAADWGLERVRVQNPSIRSYLGCIRLLEDVLDSNYAILHSSPERVLKIWHRINEVCRLMRSDLAPNLKEPSVMPRLGEARRHADAAFVALADEVLAGIERHASPLHPDLSETRRLLCVSIGRIHAFLRDTFGEIVASDPRSRHDADYFLSRRFAQDIDESEWLYSSVYDLNDLLLGLAKACSDEFSDLLSRMQRERMIPSEPAWELTRQLLETLLGDLMPKLKEVLSLKGIRLGDMEALEPPASRIASDCHALLEIHAVGRGVIEQLKRVGGPTLADRERRVESLVACHRVVSGRMIDLLWRLRASLGDLSTLVASAKTGIEGRRALMLAKDLVEFRPPTEKPIGRIF
jgi:hypothetical protein